MTVATLGIAVQSNADTAAVDLDKLTTSAGRAEVGVTRLAGASTKTAAATAHIGLNSANLAAQLQDIGVSAQMGMSALQVGLQQGTQIAAVLNSAGGLRGEAGAIGAAFMSVVNPISLISIGLAAAGTIGIQALMGLLSPAKSATDALEEHEKELDRILEGYEKARDAADRFLEAASRRPQGAVESDLAAAREAALDNVKKALRTISEEEARVAASFGDLGFAGDEATLKVVRGLDNLGLSLDSSKDQVDAVVTRLTQMANDNTLSDKARKYASDLLPFITRLVEARNEVGSLGTAIRALPSEINIALNVAAEAGSKTLGDAVDQLKSLAPELRSAREQAKDALNEALGSQSIGGPERLAALKQYQETIAAIDEQDRRREAERASRSTAKEFDSFGNTLRGAQERLATQQLELQMFGQSTEAMETQRVTLELTNQAKAAGVDLNSQLSGSELTVAEAIAEVAQQTGSATAELERMQRQQSKIDQVNNTLASGFASLFGGILNGSKSAADGVADLLNNLVNLGLNVIFQTLFSPVATGGLGFGLGMGKGGLLGGAIIPGILHSGGTVGRDGYNHQRSFHPDTWRNAQRLHSGGDVLGPDEVPAILQKGEKVIPRGGNGSGETIRVVLQDDSGRMADIADQRIQTASGTIVEVSVARSVEAVRNNQPGLSAEAQQRFG